MARPLERLDANGKQYVRPSGVDTQIDEALQLSQADLRKRLTVQDPKSAEYLRSECLVHLVREGLRTRNNRMYYWSLTVLLSRCKAKLHLSIRNSLPNPEAIREEILSQFATLFVPDQDQEPDLDFYECRFNSAFRTLQIDVVRSELRQVNRIAVPTVENEEGESDDSDEAFSRLSPDLQTLPSQENSILLRQLLTHPDITPQEKDAIVLVAMGFKIESNDPMESTAAKICGCDGRTIRNRLARARAKLSRLQEDT